MAEEKQKQDAVSEKPENPVEDIKEDVSQETPSSVENSSTDKGDSVHDDDTVLAMLASITADLEEMRKIRKRQGRYAIIGVLATLAILISFMINLAEFGNSFRVQDLLTQISANSEIVTNSREVQKVVDSAKKVFVPAYKKELIKQLQSEAPQIESTAITAVNDFRKFMMTDIRRKMVQRMDKALRQVEKDIIQHYSKSELSSDELEKMFQDVNAHFADEFTARLEKRLDVAIKKLAVLNDEVKGFENTPEYKKIKPEDLGLIENRMIEDMLRLWIYHLNPDKGETKVNMAKGGVK